MATPPRIILLDDHPLLLDGLATFIANAGLGVVVGRYMDTESALAALGEAAPDVAIVDVKVHGSFCGKGVVVLAALYEGMVSTVVVLWA